MYGQFFVNIKKEAGEKHHEIGKHTEVIGTLKF